VLNAMIGLGGLAAQGLAHAVNAAARLGEHGHVGS
jgi:hypothetical protein